MTASAMLKIDALSIRSITPADSEQLRALYKWSLEHNRPGFVQNTAYHGDIADRAALYQSSRGAMLGLFTTGDELLGFGGLKPAKNEGHVELCNLHLHPDYQGLGLGKRLAQSLIKEAEKLGYGTLDLHVTVTQTSALGLYKRLGFVETHRQVYEVEGQSYDTQHMALALKA